MAGENEPTCKGFDDERFHLIRGDYWKLRSARRPLFIQAWIAEFADVLKTEIILNRRIFPYPESTVARVNSFGAIDILSYLENHAYITPESVKMLFYRTNYKEMKDILQNLRNYRNEGTHRAIEDARLLNKILLNLKTFCEKFQPKYTKGLKFGKQCQKELQSLREFYDLY